MPREREHWKPKDLGSWPSGSPSSPLLVFPSNELGATARTDGIPSSIPSEPSFHTARLIAIWDQQWFGASTRLLPPPRQPPSDTSVTSDSARQRQRGARALSEDCSSHDSQTLAPAKAGMEASGMEASGGYHRGNTPPTRHTSIASTPVAASPRQATVKNDADPCLPLGTWATRQVRLSKDPSAEDLTRHGEAVSSSLVTQGLRQHQAALEAARAVKAAAHRDDEVAAAAWRWRFARRWQAEQMREIDPNDGDMDKTEEALQLLQAGGGHGWTMQMNIARTSSDVAGQSSSLGLCKNGSSSLVGFDTAMLNEEELSGNVGLEATKELSALHRRAEQLAKQQEELELKAQQQWQKTLSVANGGEAWAGGQIPAVEVDDWGSFNFLVIRVSELSGRQRVIVHGRNRLTGVAILERVAYKLQQLSGSSSLPADTLVVMGGGIMDWSKAENDKQVHLHSVYCNDSGCGGGAASRPSDLLNLAAVLVKQSLPASYVITTG